jgi:ubiquinone/menaquinone biosynthesis C-methylase UbiE
MVRETAAAVRRAGWLQIDVQHMSADALRFPEASFDWVLCGFALWFFPQPHRALQEFCRVLKPGGRVGLLSSRQMGCIPSGGPCLPWEQNLSLDPLALPIEAEGVWPGLGG